MTRKRFIKQLMGAGMSRNDAVDCAELARNAGRPYYPVLADLLAYHRPQFKYMPLAWLKIRYTIIHGRDSVPARFFANIDEVHAWPADVILDPAIHHRADGSIRIKEISICTHTNRIKETSICTHTNEKRVSSAYNLPPLNPNARMDGTTERIILHPGQPSHGGGGA